MSLGCVQLSGERVRTFAPTSLAPFSRPKVPVIFLSFNSPLK